MISNIFPEHLIAGATSCVQWGVGHSPVKIRLLLTSVSLQVKYVPFRTAGVRLCSWRSCVLKIVREVQKWHPQPPYAHRRFQCLPTIEMLRFNKFLLSLCYLPTCPGTHFLECGSYTQAPWWVRLRWFLWPLLFPFSALAKTETFLIIFTASHGFLSVM